MADDKAPALPEGRDRSFEGAERSPPAGGTEDTTLVAEREIPAPRGVAERPVTGSGRPEGGLADRLREGGEKLANQAGDKARGLVTQGLERTAEALANVSKMVGDTAPGIEERLGPDYGDYARPAAGAVENVANTIEIGRAHV